MHLELVCVGRQARDPLLESAATYLERLQRYTSAALVRVREGTPEDEAQHLLARWGDGRRVALDETGKQLDTVAMAEQLRAWRDGGTRRVGFVIGGADGLHASVKERASDTWSLSRLTLPHRLAQVVLLEQLYRCFTILRGEKYHRA